MRENHEWSRKGILFYFYLFIYFWWGGRERLKKKRREREEKKACAWSDADVDRPLNKENHLSDWESSSLNTPKEWEWRRAFVRSSVRGRCEIYTLPYTAHSEPGAWGKRQKRKRLGHFFNTHFTSNLYLQNLSHSKLRQLCHLQSPPTLLFIHSFKKWYSDLLIL